MIKHDFMKKISWLVIITFVSVYPLLAQRPIGGEEVRVVAPFKPAVMEATKITENPETDETPIPKPVFEYKILPRLNAIDVELEPIPAARMRGEPLERLYNGHIRGGFGTYTTPFAELFFNSLRSDTYSMGIHLKHFSSSGTIADHGYSAFSDNLARMYGRRFIGSNSLEGGLSYQRNLVHHYGFKPDELSQDPLLAPIIDALTREDLRQVFNHFHVYTALGSHHTDSGKLAYRTRIDYHSFAALKEANEQNIRFTGSLGHGLELPVLGKSFLQLSSEVDYYAAQTLADTSHTAVVKVMPTAHFQIGRGLKIDAGFAVMVQSDTASYARLYPHLGMNVRILENFLTFHGSLTGGLTRNSLRSLATQNPFINTSSNLGFQDRRLEIEGGLKAAFSDNVSLNFSVSVANFRNFALFVSDTTAVLQNLFITKFDNLHRMAFRGELTTHWGQQFHANLSVSIFEYSFQNELRPWHLPSAEVTFSARYNIQNRVILTADIFGRDAVYARTFNPAGTVVLPKRLHDMHVDANFGLEYKFSPTISIFANFSNVGNRSLQRWLNYPSQKFRFMAGASFSF